VPEPFLDVRDLTVRFRTRRGTVTAVDGLSFTVDQGEVLGIVGESGSGKSVSMMSLMRLIRDPNASVSGHAYFRGRDLAPHDLAPHDLAPHDLAPRERDLVTLPEAEMRGLRGREIAMIFQDPMTSLTPVYTVGWQIAEQIRAHEKVAKKAAMKRAADLLGEVGIPDPARRLHQYPHEFSGGMRQRVMIAMALSCNPALLIADEPTTALDVTTQAQILDLIRRLQEAHGSSVILITHDMGVVSEIADRVLVMYAGRAAEQGPKSAVFRRPQHPYTWGLLSSVPNTRGGRVRRLPTIPGSPPSPLAIAEGCAFGPRCRLRHDACAARPALDGTGDHVDACWLPRDDRQHLRLQIEQAAVRRDLPSDLEAAQ
jgi:peptide/nickel transport system ATP-binding protein